MINYYFMVCESLHEKRTKPLYNTVIKKIKEHGDNFYLLGGFETADELPIIKVCDLDDYSSCVEKTESIFRRDWSSTDWHMICDDDTFVHTDNLNSFISTLSEDNLRIYCSKISEKKVGIYGGAGILFNNKTFKFIKKYVEKNGWRENRYLQTHSDVALEDMCYLINRKTKVVNNKNKKIRISYPNTMYGLNYETISHRLFKNGRNSIKVEVKKDLISAHIKDLKYMWPDFNGNECPYKSLYNAFCKS